jgi:hypothetical protein
VEATAIVATRRDRDQFLRFADAGQTYLHMQIFVDNSFTTICFPSHQAGSAGYVLKCTTKMWGPVLSGKAREIKKTQTSQRFRVAERLRPVPDDKYDEAYFLAVIC